MNPADASQIAGRLPQDIDLSQRHTWNPPLSGDINIVIDRRGHWFHNGAPFLREKIVRLFCQLLRREADDYFLVTPVEKWRIGVAAAPLLVIDMQISPESITATANDGSQIVLDSDHPIGVVRSAQGAVPVILVRDGLQALIPRHYYYRLAEQASWEDGTAWLGQGDIRQPLPALD